MVRGLCALAVALAIAAPQVVLAGVSYRCASMDQTMATPCCPSTDNESLGNWAELDRVPCCEFQPAHVDSSAEPRIDQSPQGDELMAALAPALLGRSVTPSVVSASHRAPACESPPPGPSPTFVVHCSLLL